MSKVNGARNGCRDVFHASLVKNAEFYGELELPAIKAESRLRNRLIPFSKTISCKDYDQWVHFYEDDGAFERIWIKPWRYLPILRKLRGVISPDFSLYRDMPLAMQQWNTYRNRSIGCWLQANGIPVICNVRWGDERTYNFCCDGAPRNNIIAVGSHGCIKVREDRHYFEAGLAYIVNKLHPITIVVYGNTPDTIFAKYKKTGIKILQFDSEFAASRRAVIT